jgi:hypothetical protein
MKTKVIDRKKKRHPRGCQCNTCDRRRTLEGAWDAMRLFIFQRDKNECQFHLRCRIKEIVPPCICNGYASLCHKISQYEGGALKYDERNVFLGCAGSNKWSKHHERRWENLWEKLWPEDIEYLNLHRAIIVHRKRGDIKAIELYYRQRLEER